MTDTPTARPFDVNAALSAVLEATRDAVRAARTRDLWRDRLDREARRRYAEESSAPSWNTPKLGKVRLDPKPATAHVRDEGALATYVLSLAPSEVAATIELDGADLEEALTALEFAGVKVHRSSAAVRPAYLKPFLEELELVEPEEGPAFALRVDAETGVTEEVPGVAVTPASATLVVTIDPALKRETLARVDHELADLREDAAEAPSDEAQQHAADVGARLMAAAAEKGLPLQPAADLTRLEDPTPLDEAASSIGDRQRAAASARAAALTAEHEARTAAAPPYTARPGIVRPSPPLEPGTLERGRRVNALAALKGDDLKRAARRRQLSTTGTKLELAQRLEAAGATVDTLDTVPEESIA